jgi:hypothetical protein
MLTWGLIIGLAVVDAGLLLWNLRLTDERDLARRELAGQTVLIQAEDGGFLAMFPNGAVRRAVLGRAQ